MESCEHYSDVTMGAMTSHITSLNRLFRRRSNKTSELHVAGLCAGNSSATGKKGPVTRKMFPFDNVIMEDFVAVRHRPI